MPVWISVNEAAQRTGYSPYHLRELINTGRIKAKKVVSVWLIDRGSLEAYIRVARQKGEKTGRKVDG